MVLFFVLFLNEVIAGLTHRIFPLLNFSRPILTHSETMGCKGRVSQASGEGETAIMSHQSSVGSGKQSEACSWLST